MRMYVYVIYGILLIGLTSVVMGLEGKKEAAAPVYYKDKAFVLLYHDVRQTLPAGKAGASTVSAEQLAEHLRMLKNRGFRIVPMDEFTAFMTGGGKLPPNAVVLTFDDGYESFYTEAFPVLKAFGARASNFIVGISSDLFNPDADPHMTWEQLRTLKKHGMGIYSHTYDLHRMVRTKPGGSPAPALTAGMFMEQKVQPESEAAHRRRISSDIAFMEKRLEQETGAHRALLAFPYGAYDETALEEGRNAGIELFFTVEEGTNAPGSRLVKRINAGEPYMTADMLWDRLNEFF
ncbi:polysaccharide deacetylase family protein [Paenibacillus sp. MBLB4367]|uniref:polysaccharide deacetylase family protein n=1 Tax=Paenibacillus sp. MBLB4367 TaxID=3384767 RepID=UPI0039081AEA